MQGVLWKELLNAPLVECFKVSTLENSAWKSFFRAKHLNIAKNASIMLKTFAQFFADRRLSTGGSMKGAAYCYFLRVI